MLSRDFLRVPSLLRGPVETFPYLFPQGASPTGSEATASGHCEDICCCCETGKRANRKRVERPVPTRENEHFLVLCGFFQKDDLHWNKIRHEKYFAGMLVSQEARGAGKESLAAEFGLESLLNLRHVFPSRMADNSRKTNCRVMPTRRIIFSYPCKEGRSCTCSPPRRRCTSPGWGTGWRHIRWCWFDSLGLWLENTKMKKVDFLKLQSEKCRLFVFFVF